MTTGTRDVGTADIFWGRVATGTPEECWLWRGTFFANGYGAFRIGGKQRRANRVSGANGERQRDIAARHGVSQFAVWAVLSGRRWGHVS